MKAAFIMLPGPAESIIYGELPRPNLEATQALVRVEAAAVNPIDTYIRAGSISMPLPLPFIIGCDLAGVVEAVGPQVTRFKPGDRVWGSNQGLMGRQGSFAEYAAVDEALLYPTPDNVSSQTAAAAALVGITAHLGLMRDAKLKPGELLFVNGGSGGVGSVVIQMAKLLGAKVATTAGTDEKTAACLKLGADLAINYNTEDVEARLREFAPQGLHVWWETLREPDFDRSVALLAERGRMILMAGRDARPRFPVGPFYVKNLLLTGFVMFLARPDEQRACADDINRYLSSGQLQPRIDRVLPLSAAAAAHKIQEDATIHRNGGLSGKIVLVP